MGMSIIKRPNNHHWIQFVHADGKRKTLRLGKCSKREAEDVRLRCERLLACRVMGGAIDLQTAQWVDSISLVIQKRLTAVGLIEGVIQTEAVPEGILALTDHCIKQWGGKPATLKTYNNTRANLVDFFGADRSIRAITAGDAEEFRRWLAISGNRLEDKSSLSHSTVSKRCQISRQYFEHARKKKWIESNPFTELKGLSTDNPDRNHEVTVATINKIMAATTDVRLKLAIALARFGGLRCPSELAVLRWEWINWEDQTMLIYAPKLEHLPRKKWRTIPIFTELRPYLDAVFELDTTEGEELVLEGLTVNEGTLRSRLKRLCERTSIPPWPRLWQNLRTTRMNELADEYPLHVVTSWIGNSPATAKRHYLQVTKDHIARAVAGNRVESPEVKA